MAGKLAAGLSRRAVARYRRTRNVAILMDAALRIPGTRFRIGLGSIIGLPPGAGDAALTAISLWIVWQGRQLGVPQGKLIRMLGNVAVETAFGSVPVLGDLMDVAWKANMRNLAIIDDHIAVAKAGRPRGAFIEATCPTGRLLHLPHRSDD